MAGHCYASTYQAVSLEMVHLFSKFAKKEVLFPQLDQWLLVCVLERRILVVMTNGNIFPVEAQIVLVKPSSRPIQHMSTVTCG